ncbi:hypothetical protein ES703_70010 [subsurface metagenome]
MLVVVHYQVGGGMCVHQAPSETIVRPRIAQVVSSVDNQRLQCACEHCLTGKELAVELHEQRCRAGGIG